MLAQSVVSPACLVGLLEACLLPQDSRSALALGLAQRNPRYNHCPLFSLGMLFRPSHRMLLVSINLPG